MLIQTRKNFDAALTALGVAEVIAVDVETDGLYVHEGNRLCGVATYCKLLGQDYWLGCYFPFRHALGETLFDQSHNLPMEWLRELNSVLGRHDVTLLFHNSKFDMGMLHADGIEVKGEYQDTLLMAHLIDENGSHRLKDLAEVRWGSSVKDEQAELQRYLKGSKRYDLVPPAVMEPYAVQDVVLTFQLWRQFTETELPAQDLMRLLSTKWEFCRCLLEMERYGCGVNHALAEQLSVDAQRRMREIEDELGFDPLKLDLLAHRLFAGPPDGLGLQPGPLTKTSTSEFPQGRPEMREKQLAAYKHPLTDIVLEYRHLVKLNSTFYQGFLQKARDGRIHPSFNQCRTEESLRGNDDKGGTKTGRLSCNHPNLQQIPRDPKDQARKLIVAPPRYRVYGFDYSQIELRIAACYANAELLLDAFRSGDDPHQITADRLGIQRTPAKHAAYTILYGGGADRLKETIERLTFQETGELIDYPLDMAKEIISGFFELNPGFKVTSKAAEQAMRRNGYVKLWNGARRHIKEEWNFHKAFNSLIQGGAAAIVEESMLRIYRVLDTKPYRMIAQIHDEIVMEIPDDFREEYLEEVREIMQWPGEKFPCPFLVDYKVFGGG